MNPICEIPKLNVKHCLLTKVVLAFLPNVAVFLQIGEMENFRQTGSGNLELDLTFMLVKFGFVLSL